jgi:predicted nucleotidyltransferase component of viral defense system
MTFQEHVRRLALKAMFINDALLNRIVLKGGNALDIVYGITERASLDLDFSMTDDFTKEDLPRIERSINQSLKKIFDPEGLTVFDVKLEIKPEHIKPEYESFWGGYHVVFKVADTKNFKENGTNIEKTRREAKILGPNNGKKFEIDISKYEFCAGKKLAEYDGYNIYVYTLEMILFEKLRAICQQTEEYQKIIQTNRKPRARDFYDIFMILNKNKIELYNEENQALINHVFECKKVPLHFLTYIKNYRDFHLIGYGGLKDTVKQRELLEPFDFYFEYVTKIAEKLCTLIAP